MRNLTTESYDCIKTVKLCFKSSSFVRRRRRNQTNKFLVVAVDLFLVYLVLDI